MLNNKRARLRVIIDTTFLLPTLGIDVGKPPKKALRKLGELNAQIHYSRFSILESLWVAARSIQKSEYDAERFASGMRSVTEGGRYEKLDENSEVFNRALELYKAGHVDMIDNILYASSLVFGLRFLTVDSGLRDFVEKKEFEMTLVSIEELG